MRVERVERRCGVRKPNRVVGPPEWQFGANATGRLKCVLRLRHDWSRSAKNHLMLAVVHGDENLPLAVRDYGSDCVSVRTSDGQQDRGRSCLLDIFVQPIQLDRVLMNLFVGAGQNSGGNKGRELAAAVARGGDGLQPDAIQNA